MKQTTIVYYEFMIIIDLNWWPTHDDGGSQIFMHVCVCVYGEKNVQRKMNNVLDKYYSLL